MTCKIISRHTLSHIIRDL